MLYRNYTNQRVKTSNTLQNSSLAPPTPMKHCEWCNRSLYALKILKCLYIYTYFAINLKYIVFMRIINVRKWVVLYFSIVFNLIMLFAMLHGIVVLSLISTQSCTFWFSQTFLLQIKVCSVVKKKLPEQAPLKKGAGTVAYEAETWCYLVVDWMEADLNMSLQPIVWKGWGLGRLNYGISPAYITKEKSVISPED